MSRSKNRFGPPNKPRPDATVAQAKQGDATEPTETDEATTSAEAANDGATPDSPVVPDALPPNSDADSPTVPDTANEATHADSTETPIASSTVRTWTADDVAAIPRIDATSKAYAHAHGTLAGLADAMRHLGAVFACTQEAEHRTLLTRAQRLHQDVAESMARRKDWQGLGSLSDVAEKATQKGG